jgi:hypothetical protein
MDELTDVLHFFKIVVVFQQRWEILFYLVVPETRTTRPITQM